MFQIQTYVYTCLQFDFKEKIDNKIEHFSYNFYYRFHQKHYPVHQKGLLH